jgi:hypothetical protein
MNEFDSLGAPKPITLLGIELAACDRQIRAMYAFAAATFESCGGKNNPACMQLARESLIAVLRACRSYEEAKQRTQIGGESNG